MQDASPGGILFHINNGHKQTIWEPDFSISGRCAQLSVHILSKNKGISPKCTKISRQLKKRPGTDFVSIPGLLWHIPRYSPLGYENATQNRRALHSLFHQDRFESCLHNNTTAIGYKKWHIPRYSLRQVAPRGKCNAKSLSVAFIKLPKAK